MTESSIFLGSGASVTLVPEVDLYLEPASITSNNILTIHSNFTNNFDLVDNLYVGCVLEFYDATFSSTEPASLHRVTANDGTTLTFTPDITATLDTANDFFHLKRYGAPCPAPKNTGASNEKRLNADNWLGIVESLTFPTNEVEVKRQNLFVGGSRNYTYQYKGIETAGNSSLGIVANHGAWLYYFFGKLDSLTATSIGGDQPSNRFTAGASGSLYFDTTSISDVGPIFHRSAGVSGDGTIMMPPALRGLADYTQLFAVDRPTLDTNGLITNPITYAFSEQDGDDLPSFALEQVFSKLPSSNTYRTDVSSTSTTSTITVDTNTITVASASSLEVGMHIDAVGIPSGTRISSIAGTTITMNNNATETGSSVSTTFTKDEMDNFVLIATGNRVNTLTMTANENEELKMTMDCIPKKVHELSRTEKYEARRNITDETTFLNYSSEPKFLQPFFFSSGSISMFGQEFLKITNFTLTMNNTLQQKRYVGIGSKSIQEAIPAQREYEISITALVTDDMLYNELKNETETSGTVIDLIFDKENGEQIRLKFNNYHVTSNTWTIPEDKGPVSVEATIIPRTLNSCTVKTHWILQG